MKNKAFKVTETTFGLFFYIKDILLFKMSGYFLRNTDLG